MKFTQSPWLKLYLFFLICKRCLTGIHKSKENKLQIVNSKLREKVKRASCPASLRLFYFLNGDCLLVELLKLSDH